MALITAMSASAQTAKEVLDKCAATISVKQGAQASFTIKGDNMNTSGTLAIKGRKFHATTPQAIVWFDGKTQWTYVKKNDEVNVAYPSESELAAINPYNFIYMYKNGYSYTMEKKNGHFIVHLTATGKKNISEIEGKIRLEATLQFCDVRPWDERGPGFGADQGHLRL